jgi:hypothetical protein
VRLSGGLALRGVDHRLDAWQSNVFSLSQECNLVTWLRPEMTSEVEVLTVKVLVHEMELHCYFVSARCVYSIDLAARGLTIGNLIERLRLSPRRLLRVSSYCCALPSRELARLPGHRLSPTGSRAAANPLPLVSLMPSLWTKRTAAMPEPNSLALFGIGLVSLLLLVRPKV